MKCRHIFALAGAGLLLASCTNSEGQRWGAAPTQWDHSKMSVQQQQSDQSECRARASYRTEREMEAEGPFATEQRDARLQQMFDRHDQAQRQRALYDNCMRDKGYVPVVPDGK